MEYPVQLITETSSFSLAAGLTLWLYENPKFMIRLQVDNGLPERTWIQIGKAEFCVKETPEEIDAKLNDVRPFHEVRKKPN